MTQEIPKQEKPGVDPIQTIKDWIGKVYNNIHTSDLKDKHLAALESHDKAGLENLLKKLDTYIGYWNEKMRDTPEEKQYMANLKSAREFLANKMKELYPEEELPPEDKMFNLINMANGRKFKEGGSVWAKITLQVPSDLTTLRMHSPDLSPEEYAEKLINEPGHLRDCIDRGWISNEGFPKKALLKAITDFVKATE